LIPGQGEFVDVPKGLTAEEYYNMPKVKSLGQGMKPEDIPNCSGARNETSDFDKEVVKKLAKDAKEAHEKAHGSLPGHVQKILDEFLKPPSINWKVVLRQFVAATIKAGTKKTWRKENRRKLPLKGSLKERKAKIVLALDTSGSIFGTPELLEEFWAEILGIRKAYNADITVVECDAEIQSVYTLKQSMKPVQPSGGGGTSFVPVYAYIAEKRMKVDVLIYLTDLYGCFPEKEYVRTLWVVCEGGANEVPFGKMIKIERRK
jgi:predicted metal-dependent peptidase